jgi:hypothetical protein
MVEFPCTLQTDIHSELIGAFVEKRSWGWEDKWLINTIELVTKERLAALCGNIDANQQQVELKTIKIQAQKAEKQILSYLSKSIEPQELVWFFNFWVKQGRLTQSIVFHDLYSLYAYRHGIEQAEYMKETMSDNENEWRFFIVLEYWRNKKNGEVFIQKIWLNDLGDVKIKEMVSGEDINNV